MAILPVGGSGSSLAGGGYRFAGRGHRFAGRGRCLRVNHKYMQVALRLSKMRVASAGCESRDASCDCQMSRDWEFFGVCLAMAYPWHTFVLSGIGFLGERQ